MSTSIFARPWVILTFWGQVCERAAGGCPVSSSGMSVMEDDTQWIGQDD